jgi:biotin transport system substrate-specific component
VPITLTTVGVMLIALLYEPKTAIYAVLTYYAAGAIGLPVFQGFAGGLRHFAGPTGGYIVGFFFAVVVMSSLRARFGSSFFGILLNCIVGTVVIYIPGVLWLSTLFGFEKAIAVGVIPFIIPGILKALVLSGCLKIVGRNFSRPTDRPAT